LWSLRKISHLRKLAWKTAFWRFSTLRSYSSHEPDVAPRDYPGTIAESARLTINGLLTSTFRAFSDIDRLIRNRDDGYGVGVDKLKMVRFCNRFAERH
jgi:hypothetical protein